MGRACRGMGGPFQAQRVVRLVVAVCAYARESRLRRSAQPSVRPRVRRAAQLRLGLGGHARARAEQRLAGGFAQGEHRDNADHRGAHQVVRGHHQIAGALDEPGCDERCRAAEQRDGDIEADRQRAEANPGGEERRGSAEGITPVKHDNSTPIITGRRTPAASSPCG